jgi:glycosyltransferase involved in cell wall biosynthesis
MGMLQRNRENLVNAADQRSSLRFTRRSSENDKPLVSVLIPTYNSERFLAKCLRTVRAQTYPNVEIIVIDNYSKDRTREIASKYANVVLLSGPERSAQLNLGVEYARGEYVYRIDSDFILASTVVEEAVRKCEVEGFDAICIPNTCDPTTTFWGKVRKLEKDCYVGDSLNVAARFIKKKLFEEVGGFDETLIVAEDFDLHNRLLKRGSRIGETQSGEIHIDEPKSLSIIARKYYYYGKTVRRFVKANPKRGPKQIGPIKPAFIRNWRNFFKDPVLTVGFILYQTVKYSTSALGFFSSLADNQALQEKH